MDCAEEFIYFRNISVLIPEGFRFLLAPRSTLLGLLLSFSVSSMREKRLSSGGFLR